MGDLDDSRYIDSDSDPYAEGFDACESAEPGAFVRCPYGRPLDSKAAALWHQGWADALHADDAREP